MNWRRFYSRYGLNLKYGFKFRKPKHTARVAFNLLRLLSGQGPLLRTVDFAPTYACNYNCTHCFASKFKRPISRKELSISDYQRCAEECMELGAVHFAFQGGEPLLVKSLEDIIRVCYPERNLIAITTNAFLLTRKRIENLKRAGADLFTISLDSGYREKHDAFRRHRGAYDRAVQATKDAMNLGMAVTFNAVVSHQTLYDDGLLKLIHFTRNLRVKLNIIYAVPIGEWAGDQSLILTTEDTRYIDKLFASYPHLRRDLDANYMVRGCGAMKEVIYVNCYGDVMACPFIHASIGNFMDEPMVQIWRRGMKIDHFREYETVCLAAEDKHFICEHLTKACHAERLPIPGHVMFPEIPHD